MPGTITRDGLIIELPQLDELTRSRMLDAIVSAYIEKHPEELRRQPAQENN